ncbi:hypothetical protein BT96DRAFT_948633 [Gymnopus androsaceus JB14]|uniref:Uncharacterized protein n=1 Tax=Gymnopus androsaceus JB14 TaxID=1447944 RepID=A0A6A4GP19_9AGAR|nr:hypothetical protein BT96DRAFT_948633 [Gymnopus androsaceus JB14]
MPRGTTGGKPPCKKPRSPLPPSSPPPPSSPTPLESPESDKEIVPASDDTEVEMNRNEASALLSMHQRDLSQLTNPVAKADCERLWQALPNYPRPGQLVEHWNQVDALIKADSNSNATEFPSVPTSSSAPENIREAQSLRRREKRRAGPNESTRVLRSQKGKEKNAHLPRTN